MALTKVTLTGSVDNLKEGFTKVNDIIDDLAAATNGLGASTIGIEDSAANMAATDVEAALAEIYTDTSASRTLADAFDEDSGTTTGLTWGYKAGVIRVDNTITSISAGTIALTDDSTNYVEIDNAGNVSKNTSAFTSGKIPIRQITTASGAQTVSTDKRAWFNTWASSTVSTRGTLKIPGGMVNRPRFVFCYSMDFDSGSEEPSVGDQLDENGGDGVGIVEHVVLSSGTWAGGDADGTIYMTHVTGTWTEDATIDINGGTANVATVDAGGATANALVMHSGGYHHSGTTDQYVYWISKIPHEFTTVADNDWCYLYIDDSAIVTLGSDVLTSSEFIDSLTEPAYNQAKGGWYNGSDRCIFAIWGNGAGTADEFYHDGELVYYDQEITDRSGDLDTSWTDVTLTMPVFTRKALACFDIAGSGSAIDGAWRTNGEASTTGHRTVRVADGVTAVNTLAVITDKDQKIEVKLSMSNASTCAVFTSGYYLGDKI